MEEIKKSVKESFGNLNFGEIPQSNNLLTNNEISYPKRNKKKKKKKRRNRPPKMNIKIPRKRSYEADKKWFVEQQHKIEYKDLVFPKRSKLGSGSSGQVVRCFYRKQPFALKIIPYSYSSNCTTILREVKSLHSVSRTCPNIIQMFEAFHIGGSIRLLLEYMDCGSLKDVLDLCGKLNINVIASIVHELLNGLKCLEEKKIIHRDMKPSNILVNHKGKVKITDFGMSKKLSNSQIASFSFKGTFIFMAPERLLGEKHHYNSDVWSLGLIALQCFIGKFPFDLQNIDHFSYLDLLKNLNENKIIKKFQLPIEFEEFVRECTIYDKQKRPSAKELLQSSFVMKYKNEDHVKVVKDFMKKVYIPKRKEKGKKRREKRKRERSINTEND